jgi:hypothetical protein
MYRREIFATAVGTLLWKCQNGEWLGVEGSDAFGSVPKQMQSKQRKCAVSDTLDGVCGNDLVSLAVPPDTTLPLSSYLAYLPDNNDIDQTFVRQAQFAMASDLNRCYRLIPDATARDLQRCGRQQLAPYLVLGASSASNVSLYVNSRLVHRFTSSTSNKAWLLTSPALQQHATLTSLPSMASAMPQQVDFLRPHVSTQTRASNPSFQMQRAPRGERALWMCAQAILKTSCQQVVLNMCHRLKVGAFSSLSQVLVRVEDSNLHAHLFATQDATACWEFAARRQSIYRPRFTLLVDNMSSEFVLNGYTYSLRYSCSGDVTDHPIWADIQTAWPAAGSSCDFSRSDQDGASCALACGVGYTGWSATF